MGCLYVYLFCGIFIILFGVLNAVPACSETERTLQSCCLCSKNDSCNRTCSEGYQPFETNATCELSTNSTTGAFSGNTTAVTVIVCIRCSKQFFDNTTGKCKCPDECQNCTIEGNCSVCNLFKYNGGCYENCPNDTVPNENDKTCVPTKQNVDDGDDDKTRIIAIAAGAGGGGLLLVIVLVIVIVCCCRRRQKPKTPERRAISILVDEKGNKHESQEGLPKSESKTTLSRPPNYENTEGTLLPSNDTIQQQGDKIFRYTKDPTEKRKNKEETVVDRSSLYGNAAMIRLQANTDLTTVSSSELLEQLELEELPTAPAPGLPPAPLPQGTVAERPEDYLDMSTEFTVGPAKHAGSKKPLLLKTALKPKESKSHAKTKMADSNVPSPTVTSSPAVKKPPDVKPKPARPGAMNLEDYENIETKSIPKGRQADLKVEQSAVDGMEDYENSKYTKDQPAKVKSKGSNSDLEDYENAESFREENKTEAKGMTKESSKTSLEDYENAAVYKKFGAVGKSERVKKSDADGDDKDMEDYENMKELGELELYENTKFPSKKT